MRICSTCGCKSPAKRVDGVLICQRCKQPKSYSVNLEKGRDAMNKKKIEDEDRNGHRRNCFGDESEMLIDHFFCMLGHKNEKTPVHIASGVVHV